MTIGFWLAEVWRDNAVAAVRLGVRIFSAICGLLAVAVLVVVYLPGRFRIDAAAGFGAPAVCHRRRGAPGRRDVAALARRRRGAARPALAAMAFTSVLLLRRARMAATGWLLKPGTKSLALLVAAEARPGDRIYHYHEFFHDFLFYAARPVGRRRLQGRAGAGERSRGARRAAASSTKPEFRRQWAGSGRVFAVARKSDITELFADPTFHYHLLAETRDHTLFSNQP